MSLPRFCWLACLLLCAFASVSAFQSIALVPYHVQKARRLQERGQLNNDDNKLRHSRRTEAKQIGALYQGYGTHYIDLWCGTPPQRQTVIVDTGSGVTAFPCNGCDNCGVPKYHIDDLFDGTSSSTYNKRSCKSESCKSSRARCSSSLDQCEITMSYAEGSRWSAVEVVDRCYVGGPHEIPLVQDGGDNGDDLDPSHASHFAFDLTFGCQNVVTGLFKTQLADGIMGMDYNDGTYWQQMFAAGKMGDEQKFALCFSRQPTASREGTESGALTLGGVDTRLHETPMVYTTQADGGRSSFFSVHVRRIMMRDGSAGESAMSNKTHPLDGISVLPLDENLINSGGVIVDSGTTDTYWNAGIKDAFMAAFSVISDGYTHSNRPMSLSEEELLGLPTILFQLQTDIDANPDMDPFDTPGLVGELDPEHPTDVILAFPPSHYMEYDPDTRKYTSRFYVTERGGSVIGANSMMGHDVLFDADNNRIGWAESSCDYTNLVTSNGYPFDITGTLQPPEGVSAEAETPVTVPVTTAPIPAPVPPTMAPVQTHVRDTPAPVQASMPSSSSNNEDESEHGIWTGIKQKGEMELEGARAKLDSFLEACDAPECRYPAILALLVVSMCFAGCLFHCCRCGRRRCEEGYKYDQAATDEIEMPSYTDDPDDDSFTDEPIVNGNGHSYSDTPKTNGSNERSKPEFQGDFY